MLGTQGTVELAEVRDCGEKAESCWAALRGRAGRLCSLPERWGSLAAREIAALAGFEGSSAQWRVTSEWCNLTLLDKLL